jgi:hypothetical protein
MAPSIAPVRGEAVACRRSVSIVMAWRFDLALEFGADAALCLEEAGALA